MSRLLKILGVAALIVVAALGTYRLYRSEDGRLTATARLADVSDLALDAPVQMADIRIGRVADIELDTSTDPPTAFLTLKVDRSARVPASVTVLLRRTSVLGEKFIELRPAPGLGDDVPLLADGADLGRGIVVSDLEQLVESGQELFAAITASELATILDEGAVAFEGQGPQLRSLVEDFSTVLEGYGEHTESIQQLITNLERFASTTGPSATAHADAVTNLAETVDILESRKTELVDLLASLDDLAAEGKAILEGHLDEIARAFDALRATTDTIAEQKADLARILRNIPGHNENLPTGVNDNFVQVLNDVIVCGMPGGGEADTPVRTCTNKYAEPIPRQSEETGG